FFFQAEDGIRDRNVTGIQTCALPILDVQKEIQYSEVVKGNGIRAQIESKNLAIGNRSLMKQENIHIPTEVEAYAIEREKLGNTRSEERRVGKECESG